MMANIDYSRVIAGTMTWGKWGNELTEKEMMERMHCCMHNGITTFDHADIYGDYTTELDFGKAFAKSGIARDGVQLISKCGIQYMGEARSYNRVKHYNYSKEYLVGSVEMSLKNLKTDYLDLLLLHRPSPLMDAEIIGETISMLKQQGKIKQFGVSNFTPLQMELISQEVDVSVNQIEFSLTQHEVMHNGTLDYMSLNGCKSMAWSPLGRVFKEDTEQTRRIHRQFGELMEKYDATEDQLLLAWIMKHPVGIHPVIGTTNITRIKNASEALAIDLELEDWFLILVASQGHKVP